MKNEYHKDARQDYNVNDVTKYIANIFRDMHSFAELTFCKDPVGSLLKKRENRLEKNLTYFWKK